MTRDESNRRGRTETDVNLKTQDRADDGAETVARVARHMARELCAGFRYHDRGEREAAVESFAAVDRRQFAHVDDDAARTAARAYVDALWAKDDLETEHMDGTRIDPDSIRDGDWTGVYDALVERAAAAELDREYATATTRAWRNHKANRDYWTPTLRAQLLEYRAAIGDDGYPTKPSDGREGFGAAPVRYLLGIELHDRHTSEHWEEAIRVMEPYYRRILRVHRAD
ncbi:hypothetical protein [Halobaculum gomorrense]|uniref:Uncharacterized protein n=1 Tax=Halobaculum gomorrense TaxID=43928 RepID=A0A1M5UDI3_9EURY|nr:hypothetical protein [Halobaculum gomorrense]SHH61112.1 hypothetical protein SAMN05443636_2992 [Halobaculum gomorrense]